jgi:peptide deformylase
MERGKDNEILRAVSAPVKKIDRKMLKFIENMKETMDHEKGVGLAAPQVGANVRVVVCKFNYDTPHEVIVPMINPVIKRKSEAMVLHDEGCLSIPGKYDSIARHEAVTVQYLDPKGRENVLKLNGFNARVVQHEVDHIEGHLYVDHLMDPATLRLKKEEAEEERYSR